MKLCEYEALNGDIGRGNKWMGVVVILKDSVNHWKHVHLRHAHHDWISIRLQYFKFVAKYNFIFSKRSSQLILCSENIFDDEIIEKILLTFRPNMPTL